MRILLLAQQLPGPITDGYNLHNHNYLLRLGARHEVDVLSYDRGFLCEELRDVLSEVETVPVDDAPQVGLVRRALDVLNERSLHHYYPQFAAALQRRLSRRSYDIVWIGGWILAQYSPLVRGSRLVFDPADDQARATRIVYENAKGLGDKAAAYRDWVRNVRFRRSYFQRGRLCLFVSHEDTQAIRREHPALRVEVLQNGTDAEYFRPMKTAAERATLVFEGTMFFPPNVDGAQHLVRDVLPLVKREEPDARVILVGRDPSAEVQALAGPDVEVTGTVDDIREHLARGAVFVCPLRAGTGIKNKVLQAWAMEMPVVATRASVTGLDARSGDDIVIAETPEDLAAACVRLIRNPAEAARLGAAGRRRVLRDFSWDAQAAQLEAWMQEIAATPADAHEVDVPPTALRAV